MRLLRLKIAGFKSFADSTVLHFKDNRTAIVGPNGCGKSNVIDAIRWVMGESSAKQLRGGQMQDVIFAGTAQRKPMGVASVELQFENTYGKLGGAYNAYHELSVKRQVTRDGKSEYFINGSRCRRRDITDIFLGTGLGPRSYAVIEQGMISRLVDAKPDEMRVFIEEAAGISRYQARRKETLQHLEHTQSNLERLNDIAVEWQAQMKTLQRQATQAEKYQQLQQQMLTLKTQLFSAQYFFHQQHIEQYQQQLHGLDEQFNQQHQQLERAEVEEILLQKQIQQQLPQAEQLQQAWQQAEQHYQQLMWQKQQDRQQQEKLQQHIQTLRQQQQTAQDEYAELQQESTQLEGVLHQLQQSVQETQQMLQDSEIDVAHSRQKFEQIQQQYEQSRQSIQHYQQQQQQLQMQYEHAQKNIQRSEQLWQQLQQEQRQYHTDDVQQQLDDVLMDLATLTQQEQTQQQQEQQLTQQLQQAREQQQHEQQQWQENQLLMKNLQRDMEKTEKLLHSLQQQSSAVPQQPLLAQLQLTEQGKQYSAWIEKLLAQWLFAQITEQLDFSVDYACQLQAGQPTSAAMPLDTLQSWIDYPQHRLWQNIGLAEDITQAQQYLPQLAEQHSIFTLDGWWLARDWAINLNMDGQHNAAQGQLQYRVHFQQLQQQLNEQQQQQPLLQTQLQHRERQVAELQQQCRTVQQQLRDTQQQRQHLQTEQMRMQMTIDSHLQKQQQVTQQLAQLQQQMEEDRLEAEQIQTDLVQIQLILQDLQPQYAAQQEQFAHHQQQLQQLQQQVQQDQQQLQEARQQLTQQQARQALLCQQLDYKEQRLNEIEEQLIDLQQQINHLQQDDVQDDSEQHAKQHAEQQQQQWLDWQQQIQQLQQQQQQYSEQRQQLQQQQNTLRDDLEQVRLQWQQHNADRQHAVEQLLQLGVKEPQPQHIDTDQVQQTLSQVEHQIAKMGAINLAAYEELQGLQQRYDELDHQMEDLRQTVAQLQDAMKSIDQETKHLFMQTFDRINAELQQLFPKVFSGGEAALTLEDGWQSGVKLMARPPGKRNSTLALLSGGEKALTALSLVFAIFRLNPAPFCVLDEVDAPLDDANVGRFCHLVEELSQQVQFIYITHNKIAMTMATDLLGVTMPEAGSSKLVAVSLAQAESYVTAE